MSDTDPPQILLVEDEPDVASFVRQGLEEEGYAVHWVETGRRALEYARQSPFDLVLLDIRLPDLSGLEVCERLRLHRPELPVMMLTALDAVEDRVQGLRAGADDYLPKPFAFDELVARIEALLRRMDRPQESGGLSDRGLVLDPVARTCTYEGASVDLTPTEFDLLAFLMARQGQALSRDTIHREVWGHDFERGTNLIDVYVNYVRRKLEEAGCDSRIDTVRGIGYRYGHRPDTADDAAAEATDSSPSSSS
jgi:two-component system OmpR family response regulator/two-component system response regulator MprA